MYSYAKIKVRIGCMAIPMINQTPIETLDEGLDQFIQIGMAARNLSARTRKEYARDLRNLLDFLAERTLTCVDQINLSHLEAYQAEMDDRGYKSSTRRRKTLAIRIFFDFLERYGALELSPAARLVPPEVKRDEPRFLSEDEYQRLLRACSHQPRDAAIVELFLQTGIRLQELTNLTLSDIELPKRINKDPDNIGTMRIQRKGGKIDTVPLNYKACRAIKSWLKVRPKIEDDALWASRYKEPMSTRAIQYAIKKYMDEAGIIGASVHSLRHTMATHHAMKGTDAKTIQETLGHASLVTTELYISLAKKAQRKALQQNAL